MIPIHKQIADYLERHPGIYFHKWDIEALAPNLRCTAYCADRRMQEMCQIGHRNFNRNIERSYDEKRRVRYRYLPPMVFGMTQPRLKNPMNLEYR